MKYTRTGQVMQFAASNPNLFDRFEDFWKHYNKKEGEYDTSVSFAEKEEKLNKELIKEIVRRSGVTYATESNVEQWAHKQTVAEETFAVVGAMIDMILPDSVLESIGLYTEMKNIGNGDSVSFDIKPRDLFVPSKFGRSKRIGNIKKQFMGQKTILTERRELTVGVSMYGVLSGKESLADLAAKIVRSMETAISLDAYNAFYAETAAMDATATTGLVVTGYSQASLLRLCEQVGAWCMGHKPIVVGTSQALLSVLPDDANYRYAFDDSYVRVGYIPNISGYDVMRLPQVADLSTEFGLALATDRLWVIAPSAGKPIKVILEGATLSNTTSPWDNADLSQTTTLFKTWGTGVATNSIFGLMTI
jgi:hypothetical protein